jgi:outer membrane protein TolC
MHARLSTMTCVLVAALCQFQFAMAQTSGGEVLTLNEALRLARSNNRDLKQFGFDVGKQREALAEAKTHLYPRFDTSVRSISRSTKGNSVPSLEQGRYRDLTPIFIRLPVQSRLPRLLRPSRLHN